jgi:hypothetical protein
MDDPAISMSQLIVPAFRNHRAFSLKDSLEENRGAGSWLGNADTYATNKDRSNICIKTNVAKY